MVNVIFQNQERREHAEFIAEKYGADMRNPEMREAAEIAAARTQEVVRTADGERRRYFY